MKGISKIAPAVLMVASALASITPGRAANIVYTNIKPGDTFVVGVGIGLIPFTGTFNYAGIGFNARQDYIFEGMELAVSLASGPNELNVFLMSSRNGLPYLVLESFTLTNEMSTDPETGLVKIPSVLHPVFSAGQMYWVVAAGGPTTFANWQENVHGVMGPNVSGPSLTNLQRDSNMNTVEALKVIGNVAP